MRLMIPGRWFPTQDLVPMLAGAVACAALFGSIGILRNLVAADPLPFIGRPPAMVQYNPVSPAPAGGPAGDVVRMVTLDQAAAMSFDSSVVFVDAREASAFSAGHIQGALSLPYHDYDRVYPTITLALKKFGTIVTYCDGGGCEASIMVARRLSKAGFATVLVFSGGWPEWLNAGYPISKD